MYRDDQPKQHQQRNMSAVGGKRSAATLSVGGPRVSNDYKNQSGSNSNNYKTINKLEKYAKQSFTLSTSEFDSGLAPHKKRKKK